MNLYESIKKNLKEHEKLNEYSGEKFNNVELTYHCNECGNSWEEDCKLSQGSCRDIKKEIDDGGSFDWYNADVPGGHCYNCGSEDTRIVDIDILNELDESVKVGPIYRLGMEEIITSYNDIRLDEIGITLEDIELFKRVDTSESAPDKVNYLLVADMHYDMDPSVSVPIIYNITDDDYEQEINPSMFNHVDEELDSEIYNTVDEAIKNLALNISQSGRMNESEEIKELSDPDLKAGDKIMIQRSRHIKPHKATVEYINRETGLLEYRIAERGFTEHNFMALPNSKFLSGLKNALDSIESEEDEEDEEEL